MGSIVRTLLDSLARVRVMIMVRVRVRVRGRVGVGVSRRVVVHLGVDRFHWQPVAQPLGLRDRVGWYLQ